MNVMSSFAQRWMPHSNDTKVVTRIYSYQSHVVQQLADDFIVSATHTIAELEDISFCNVCMYMAECCFAR